jgi:hypothetical protein
MHIQFFYFETMKHRIILSLATLVISSLPITAGAATTTPTLATRMQWQVPHFSDTLSIFVP